MAMLTVYKKIFKHMLSSNLNEVFKHMLSSNLNEVFNFRLFASTNLPELLCITAYSYET